MPGYQREDYYQPSGIDTGQAGVYGALAGRLREFSERAKNQADTLAIPKAEQRGAEAAAAGDTNLKAPINRVARAYNDGLIRAYALDSYADVHEKLSQFEIDAGTDAGKFKAAVAGYRSGKIPATLPAAQPILLRAIQEREADGMQRIGTLKANETHIEAVAQADRGRATMQDQISRGYTSGDPEKIARADELSKLFVSSLEGDVVAGLKTRREADAQIDKFLKDTTSEVALGKLQEELDKPDGDPIKVIEETLAHADPILSDEERMVLVGSMFSRVNAQQALATERVQQQTLQHQAQWDAGEKYATTLQLQGQVTLGILARMVNDDQLDPAIGRSIASALKSGSGTGNSNEELLVGLNLLAYTEEEIYLNPDLSSEAKFKFINERRDQDDSWKRTQVGVEGSERIDRALNIVPGTNMNMLTEAQKRARGMALGEWYDRVDAMPDDERSNAAILDMSESVIAKVILRNVALAVERQEANRDAFIKSQPPRDTMDDEDRAEFDSSLALYDQRVANERKKSQQRPHR